MSSSNGSSADANMRRPLAPLISRASLATNGDVNTSSKVNNINNGINSTRGNNWSGASVTKDCRELASIAYRRVGGLATPLSSTTSFPQATMDAKYTLDQVSWSDSIEDYDLGGILGKGGFGTVYEAKTRKEGYPVAIKMIDKKIMRSPSMSQRVRNEVEIHWQLSHPSILALYAYFEDSSCVYLVMERCEGGELFKYVNRRKRETGCAGIEESEAAKYIRQIVSGLMYLHSHGIIHRDLKMSNILLTKEMDVKIADFGLAVRLEKPDAEQKTMCGTPNYISPEIVQRRPYGLASDVWSLGCILVTLLTGSPPFESSVVKNTLDKVSKGEYSLPDYVGVEAKDLIRALLQKDPKTRFPLNKILQHAFLLKYDEAYKMIKQPKLSPNTPHTIVESQPSSSPPSPAASVKPLSTMHLKPVRQITKQASIQILKDGRVYMEISSEKHPITISGNGIEISFWDVAKTNGGAPALEPGQTAVRSYRFDALPPKYAKYYQFAFKFVDLVRCRTPRVILQTSKASVSLMQNIPDADCEAVFVDGTKLRRQPSKSTLEATFSDGEKAKFTILESDFGARLNPYVKHLVDSHRICLQIDKKASDSSQTVSFPIVMRIRPASSSAPATTKAAGATPAVVAHSSSASMSVSSPASAESPIKASAVSISAESAATGRSGSVMTYLPATPCTSSTAHAAGQRSRDHDRCTTLAATADSKIFSSVVKSALTGCQFLQDVGWCLQANNGNFMMVLNDGVRLIVDARSTSVTYYPASGQKERYAIEKSMPEHVKARLVHFQQFIRMLQTQNYSSRSSLDLGEFI